MKTLKKIFAALMAIALTAAVGCKKDDAPAGFMAMHVTETRDNPSSPPSNMTAVYIEVTSVEVHYANEDEGNSGWVALHTKAGIYDLLALQNDVTAVLADDTKLPIGEVTQIRLILGSKNSIVITGNREFPLVVPSGEQSGIKINVNTSIPEGLHMTVTLAFDADKSIVLDGNGEYKLKPVIAVKSVVIYK